jgi:ATP adenylyltransferase
LERLWSPWRAKYVAASGGKLPDLTYCILCEIQKSPEENFIVHTAEHVFIVLNLHPYVSGHLLIAPRKHISEFDSAPKEITDEMIDILKRCQSVLRAVYQPEGFNIGMNLGRPAGAGIADHIHMHILPRWTGDTNFMTTVAESRVIPEALELTWQKLRSKF